MPDFSKNKVLIVEGSPSMRTNISAMLNALGVGRIDAAASGEEGYKLFSKYGHDLVIADRKIEPMDVLELSRKIRTDPLSPKQQTSIILMTGQVEVEWMNEARDTGVSHLLVKPFSSNDLVKRITHVLKTNSNAD